MKEVIIVTLILTAILTGIWTAIGLFVLGWIILAFINADG